MTTDTIKTENGGFEPSLTIPEVSQIIRVSRTTIWRMIKRGQLDSYMAGGQRRITRAAVRALQQHEAA